jgi:hypothetical protein
MTGRKAAAGAGKSFRSGVGSAGFRFHAEAKAARGRMSAQPSQSRSVWLRRGVEVSPKRAMIANGPDQIAGEVGRPRSSQRSGRMLASKSTTPSVSQVRL